MDIILKNPTVTIDGEPVKVSSRSFGFRCHLRSTEKYRTAEETK